MKKHCPIEASQRKTSEVAEWHPARLGKWRAGPIFLISLSLCIFASLHLCISVALAQSPTPEEAPTPEVTQINNEKVKEIRDQVREKIQEKIQEIREKGKLRGYVGEILKIDGLEITLGTKRGEREITIDENVKIIGPKRQSFEPEDLEVGDSIICMGNVDQNGQEEMIAKRIVVVPKPLKSPKPRQAIFGQVTEINQGSLILSLIHPRKENLTFQVKATDQTRITKKVEGKIQKVKFSAIEEDNRLIAVGTWDEDEEILTAKIIHAIPASPNASQGGPGKAKGQGE